MRSARLIVPGKEAVTHCWCDVSADVDPISEAEMDVLVGIMRHVLDYTDIEMISYAVTPRRFDVLVRVPKMRVLSDAEMLERAQLYYEKAPAQLRKLELELERHSKLSPEGKGVRRRAQMNFHNVSRAIGLIKHRFLTYRRKVNGRSVQQFWTERFKSKLVEDRPEVIAEAAAHVDARPLWDGVAEDVRTYAYSSFGEACDSAGDCREAIKQFTQGATWAQAKSSHLRMVTTVEPPRRTWDMPRAYGNVSVAAVKRSKEAQLKRHPQFQNRTGRRKGFDGWVKELRAFKKKHGHCHVSTNEPATRSLGRWLGKMRHRYELIGLDEAEFNVLDKLGVSWEPRKPGRQKRALDD